jgi:hypothetical protein
MRIASHVPQWLVAINGGGLSLRFLFILLQKLPQGFVFIAIAMRDAVADNTVDLVVVSLGTYFSGAKVVVDRKIAPLTLARVFMRHGRPPKILTGSQKKFDLQFIESRGETG